MNILWKKILILQRIVGKNDNFKKLTMPLSKYLGMSYFQKGVIWGVFVLFWHVRVSRTEIGRQYFRCDQFSDIGTIACGLYNFYKDQIISTNLYLFLPKICSSIHFGQNVWRKITNLQNVMTETKKKAIFHNIYSLFLFIAQKIKNKH